MGKYFAARPMVRGFGRHEVKKCQIVKYLNAAERVFTEFLFAQRRDPVNRLRAVKTGLRGDFGKASAVGIILHIYQILNGHRTLYFLAALRYYLNRCQIHLTSGLFSKNFKWRKGENGSSEYSTRFRLSSGQHKSFGRSGSCPKAAGHVHRRYRRAWFASSRL